MNTVKQLAVVAILAARNIILSVLLAVAFLEIAKPYGILQFDLRPYFGPVLDALGSQAFQTLIMCVVLLGIYFIPWLVAKDRRHRNASAIAVLNIFLGWTFLGWVAALVWAMTNNVAPPRVQIIPPNRTGVEK